MPLPRRMSHLLKSIETLFLTVAIFFWVSAIPLAFYKPLRWLAALNFLAGLVLMLAWQMWTGVGSPKSAQPTPIS
ncbi:type VI protein secretion system component VasK [Silvibacterium bohemicum]|uniref:Type VI protein secretion system component VasK n=1 Tax=Silvibacterium bohemicum TaxID=1577686 RepID=A0A841K0P6_9BACT|nr:hypothetical protein [Silvibacterium bohemicum]MBB6145529.1 type VI protein secretion system component VasK [Silvibacterium bohemicum]